MCLISTMFYVLMPKFIEEGRLCWLRAPLYHISNKKEIKFAYSEKEIKELHDKYPSWEQGYYKGLGEMSSTDVEQSMLHPTERRLEQLTIYDTIAAKKSIEMLMGEEVAPRKEFLFKNVDFNILNS